MLINSGHMKHIAVITLSHKSRTFLDVCRVIQVIIVIYFTPNRKLNISYLTTMSLLFFYRGVLLTVPRVVQPGSQERACLMLHQFSQDSTVDLQLFILQSDNTVASERHTFWHGKMWLCFFCTQDPRLALSSHIKLLKSILLSIFSKNAKNHPAIYIKSQL